MYLRTSRCKNATYFYNKYFVDRDRYLNSISPSLHDVERHTSRCLRRWSYSGSVPLQIAGPRRRRHSPRREPTPSRIASQVSLPAATRFSCPSLARASHFYALVSAHCNPHGGSTLSHVGALFTTVRTTILRSCGRS